MSCMHRTHLTKPCLMPLCLNWLSAQACNGHVHAHVQLVCGGQLDDSHGPCTTPCGQGPISVGSCLTLHLPCTTMIMEKHAGVGLSMAGPTLISSGKGLHARASTAEQMVAAAAALAATAAPLARLAIPTVSEGPSSVLQVSCRRWQSNSDCCLPFRSQHFQSIGVPTVLVSMQCEVSVPSFHNLPA